MHMVRDMVAADRRAGYSSRSIVFDLRIANYGLVNEGDFDLVLNSAGYGSDELHWGAIYHLLLSADIWVTFFDSVFFPESEGWKNAFVLRSLCLLGVRIIVTPGGLDVVHVISSATRFDWVGRVLLDYPNWDLRTETPLIRRRIAQFTRVASLVVGADSTTNRFLPRVDLSFKTFPVVLPDGISTAISPERRLPQIVHAPNHRNIKGTACLLTAVESLNSRGFDCELRIVEKMPRPAALEAYAAADILADQFCMGAFGVFALEGLLLGKPVLTYLDEEHLSTPAYNLPLVNTNPENLERVLQVLVALPELRARLGRAGRAAAERYQSVGALAEVWGRIYEHVWWGAPLDLQETQHFSPERKRRSFSEDPADLDFWPVPVDDLMDDIRAILQGVSRANPGERERVVRT